MRLELRNDRAVQCEHCGTAAPILIAGMGPPIVADITKALEEQWCERESLLQAIAAEERGRIVKAGREGLVSMEQVMRQEVEATRVAMTRAHEDYEAAVADATKVRARWYRPLRRRWERQLATEVEAAVAHLREQTRRA